MFLIEPDETRYDLRWHLFGTPVRVHPMFWLVSIILGYDSTIRAGVGYLLAWVGCVFFSILLHEFGHVWMGQMFGSSGHIVLYSFGGLAIGSKQQDRRWQRILVSLAGPLIQLVFLALLWFGKDLLFRSVPLGWRIPTYRIWLMLIEINLLWPLLNLLPIWPLDGGQISREVCQGVMPAQGTSFSLGLSMVVAGFLAVHEFMASKGRPLFHLSIPESSPMYLRLLKGMCESGSMFNALFFALFCVSSFMALQAENQRRRSWSDDEWV
ncbi:MAG TPA: site-2 protease family protein [Gemmataceae bacterium]|nr:site-2 protease family protein [Gemmataceae bacterium]